jgi:hypothetical protein
MALKIVLFYNQFDQGWSETYYVNVNTPPSAYLDSISQRQWSRFVSLRHVSCSLYAARATVLFGARQSDTTVFSGARQLYGSQGTSTSSPGTTADLSSTSANIRLVTDPQTPSRVVAIRGLLDADVVRDAFGGSTPSATLNDGISRMVGQIIQLGWQVRTESRPPASPFLWIYPNSLVSANTQSSNLQLNAAAALNLTTYPMVVFQGIPHDDLPGFPRTATVQFQSAGAPFIVTIPYRFRASTTPYIFGARFRFCSLGYEFTNISGWEFLSFQERKTGRGFGVPRGRSKGLVRAQ